MRNSSLVCVARIGNQSGYGSGSGSGTPFLGAAVGFSYPLFDTLDSTGPFEKPEASAPEVPKNVF